MPSLSFSFKRGDKWFFIMPFILSLFGLMAVFDASSVSALRDFNDKFHFLKNQAVWFFMGFLLFFIFSRLDLRFLKKISFPLLVLNIFFLILVLIPGVGKEIYGGKRWLNFFGFGFQPAEMTKLTLIIYFSTFFEKKKPLLPFLTIIGIILGLLVLEPDLGSAAIIISTALCLYFIAGAPLKTIFGVSLLGMVLFPVLVLFSPYRKQRLVDFLSSAFDIKGASYHVKQVLIALGSGGFFGRGFGQSRQKFLFLPEAVTDSIAAVLGEEFGFLGLIILVLAFLFLVYRIFKLAMAVKDPFSKILLSGIAFFLGIQTVINLGAIAVLVPFTGVPLPFISYGGSSLLICLVSMGIVYNISRKNLKF